MELPYNNKCTDCELHKRVKNVCIPGRGNLFSEVLVVGEAPREDEDEGNDSFIGWDGEVLDYGLSLCGIDARIECGVIKCRPPLNRNPSAVEIKACHHYLDSIIILMPNLKVILALGNIALKFFTGKQKITKNTGNPMPYRTPDGRDIKIMPLFHPVYLLRNSQLADKFENTIKTIPTLLSGIDSSFVRLVDGEESVKVIEHNAGLTKPVVAFDLETTGLDPFRGSVLMVSFYTGRRNIKPVSCNLDTPNAVRALRKFYESDVKKVVHNVAFEWKWGKYNLGVELNNVVADTMILSIRQDNNRPFNLGSVAATFVPEVVGFKIDSQSALADGEYFWNIDKTTLGMRNAIDAYATWVAYHKLMKELR